jgi:Glycosyltransferase family 87
MQHVLLPWERYSQTQAGTMTATLGDLYSPWFGSRALLLYRQNPYGPEVTHEIQMAFYGHDIVQSGAPGTRTIDEQRFAYPVYAVFLLAPLVRLSFETANDVVPVVLAAAVVTSVLLWTSAVRWRTGWKIKWAAVLFVLGSPQVAQGLRLRQVGMIVGAFLALAAWLVIHDHLVSAGVVLALSTIKPQMLILPLAWFLLWSLGNFRERWRLPATFAGMLAILISLGELILPGWLRYFFQALIAYRRYGPTTSLLQLALGAEAGIVLSMLLLCGLLFWAGSNRHQPAESSRFIEALSLFLMAGALLLPLMTPFNQILLLLPTLLLLRNWDRIPVPGRAIFATFASWPWLISLVLLVLKIQPRSSRPIAVLPATLALFIPFVLPLLLYSRRTLPV